MKKKKKPPLLEIDDDWVSQFPYVSPEEEKEFIDYLNSLTEEDRKIVRTDFLIWNGEKFVKAGFIRSTIIRIRRFINHIWTKYFNTKKS
ncbi:MAG: hypothetical protein NT007_00375 [Candidatus Kapabacteria bacterium]|nr:hypothetical protein [Candidatus Kapabacteria bacterium]